MALQNLLKLAKLKLVVKQNSSQLNFPFPKSSNIKRFNYNFENLISSTPKNLRSLAATQNQSLTPLVMERENTQRRFAMAAMMMLLSVNLAASFAFASSEVEFVKKTISSNKIVIFSKSYCPYCRRAKDVFKELNQAPHVIELDERDDGWNIQDALSGIVGRRTVPQVFINGKHIGGSDDTVEAYQNGELAKLLGISSVDRDDL